MTARNDGWTGRLGFVLATIGSAVGLGSIWKFPYEVGENGGSGFVLIYLLGLTFIVAPVMLAEFAIGRSGKSDARRSIEIVARSQGSSTAWRAAGTLGVVTSALILSFYSVIGGWALGYAVETARSGLPGPGAEAVQAHFDAFTGSAGRLAIYHTVFMAAAAFIVARGVADGIEKAAKILMPILVILMIVLAGYSVAEGDVGATTRYLFSFDPARITARTVLEAMGLGLFSIGVGLAVMITYAAYAGPEIDLRTATVVTIVGDTLICVLAGFAVFPIVFANGLDPAGGPGLMFVTLPLAFATMPAGALVAVAFYVLLVIAALISAISLLEMPVALARGSLGWSRRMGVSVSATLIWLLGFASVFSFNLWRSWFPLSAYPAFATSTFFDLLDFLTSNILLPIGGLLLALFAGWALPRRFLMEPLGLSGAGAAVLRIALRYIAPAAILAAAVLPFLVR